MKFGLLKSKIENVLIESYKNNSLKDSMFVFNELILKNKNINKLFYLYDELNSNKGLSESIANEYINESIVIYENVINKIDPKELKEIQMWVGHIQCENEYEKIDDLFTHSITEIENKITSKKIVLESLTKSPKENKEIINIPIKTMVNIANKTISNYIESLNESDKKELKKLFSEDDETSEKNYSTLKEDVISKLEKLKESENENEIISKIDETIQKITNESFEKMNYFKLQKLNENL